MRAAWGLLLACTVLAPASAAELSCADGLDDDGDGRVDCADADCIADPQCARVDFDRDGAANADDCAPADPTAFAVPPEIPRLDVRRLAGDEVLLAWIGVAAQAGTGTRYDVATGTLADLAGDRGALRAELLATGLVGAFLRDDRPAGGSGAGFWYLAGARNACGRGPFGEPGLDADGPFDEMGARCFDGVDNDGDGAFDCDDLDCDATPGCDELCANGRDDDGDGRTDCLDTECAVGFGCPESDWCFDRADNDGNGLADCDDPACAGSSCPEICGDGRDNDGDTQVDCGDPDCASVPSCAEDCVNGPDDDGDGRRDCDDEACQSDSTCCSRCSVAASELPIGFGCRTFDVLGSCPRRYFRFQLAEARTYVFSTCGTCGSDGRGDTLLRLLDSGCRTLVENDDCPRGANGESELRFTAPVAGTYLLETLHLGGAGSWVLGWAPADREDWTGCADGVDGDLDGAVDCADTDCSASPSCLEDCANGADEDADGLVDCGDPDCAEDPACPEDCLNAIDDDGDTMIDCRDPDCRLTAACTEICDDGVDQQGDGIVDCSHPACIGFPGCPEAGHCADGGDNDSDGLVDCADPDCSADLACPEDCRNGIDDDADSLADCLSPDCTFHPDCCQSCARPGSPLADPEPACQRITASTSSCSPAIFPVLLQAGNSYAFSTCGPCGSSADFDTRILLRSPSCVVVASSDDACGSASHVEHQVTESGVHAVEVSGAGGARGAFTLGWVITACRALPECAEAAACADGVDNDGDGEADCSDTHCLGSPDCPEAANCRDAIDNDLDGWTDCHDLDCYGATECEHCTDTVDDDADGLIDCADPDCRFVTPCQEWAACFDGIDNDGNGLADCEDEACWLSCPEVCDNGYDDNQDGLIDCEEPSCTDDLACPENCTNAIDDDADGLSDCADEECTGPPC